MYQLGELCNQITDGTHYTPKYVDEVEGKIKFISVKDVRESQISFEDVKYISEEEHLTFSKRCNPQPEDILLTKIGTIGLAAVIPDDAPVFDIFVSVCLIKPRKEIINTHFLNAVLNSPVARLQFARDLKGVGVPDLHLENIAETFIPLPPLETQRSLVTEIEAARQARKRKLAQADELLSSLDAYLLEQLGLSAPEESDRQVFAIRVGQMKSRLDSHSNQPRFRRLLQLLQSHRFSVAQLVSVSTDIFSGITPKSGGAAYTEELSGVPFIRSGEITKDGRVIEDNAILIKPEIHEGLMRRSQLQQGDLLIAIVGATIGSVGVYDRSDPANINQAIAAVRLNSRRVLPDFARWFLSSPTGQMILDYLKRPVARANINLEEIGEIPILLPPLEIQHSIVEQVDHTRLEMRRLRQEAEIEWESAKTRFEQKLLGEEA